MTSPVPQWEVASQGPKLLGSFLPESGAFAASLGKLSQINHFFLQQWFWRFLLIRFPQK